MSTARRPMWIVAAIVALCVSACDSAPPLTDADDPLPRIFNNQPIDMREMMKGGMLEPGMMDMQMMKLMQASGGFPGMPGSEEAAKEGGEAKTADEGTGAAGSGEGQPKQPEGDNKEQP